MVFGDSASAILGIELGAQAAAAHESLRSRPSTDPARGASAGYLVSIRNADFLETSIPVGVDLRVEANLVGSAGPLAMYEVSVSREDSALLLIKAAISTMSVQSRPQ